MQHPTAVDCVLPHARDAPRPTSARARDPDVEMIVEQQVLLLAPKLEAREMAAHCWCAGADRGLL